MMLGLLVRLLALYIGSTPACAQTAAATQLLTRGPGAEAAALAGSLAPTVHDPTALYWNPAGLAAAGGMVSGEHLFLFDGARYDFIGLSVPSRFGTFGLGALQLNRGDIIARSSIDDPGTAVSNTQSDYMLGFGRAVTEHWSVGATANILDFNLAGYKDKGWGLDVGGQGNYPEDDFWGLKHAVWSFGASIKNLVEPRITLMSDTEAFPRELRGGAGLSFQTASRPSTAGIVDHDRALVLLSARRASGDPSLHPGLGLAYTYQDLLVFRLGFDGALSAGMGLHTMDGRFIVDYALENRPLSFNHRFTISYRFLTPKAKPQESYREEIDEEYARAKGQAEALAQENHAAAQSFFKDQRYPEAREPSRLAALLAPDDQELARSDSRAAEAFRRAEIRRLSTDATLAPAPGGEAQAYANIVMLLDLGAENKDQLAALLQRLAPRIPAEELVPLSQRAFDERAAVARSLTASGHIEEARRVERTLAVIKSSQSVVELAALEQLTEAKAQDIRKQFDELAGQERGDVRLVKAALALKRAFPEDPAAAGRADAALARYRADYPVSIRERFYLLKLYYLAAVRYAKKGAEDVRYAADLLGEILRRDPTNLEADSLLDTMAREGLVRQ